MWYLFQYERHNFILKKRHTFIKEVKQTCWFIAAWYSFAQMISF